MKEKNPIAFPFVLERLQRLAPTIRPMFGCHAIYCGEKVVLVTRDKHGKDADDGVWIATTKEHHLELRKMLPSLRSISIFGSKESSWQVLPKTSETFEEEVLKACELVLRGDSRIGTVPKKKSASPKVTQKRSKSR